MLFELIFFFFSYALALQSNSPSHSIEWLRAYQYKIEGSSYVSDIQNDSFFFTENGRQDPYAEYLKALEIYSNDQSKIWGQQKDYASCAFPARKRILEKISGKKFPKKVCSEFNSWKSHIASDHLKIVFAGAFLNNPASIMGHTFLRLAKADENRSGSDLLSYSVGYLAQTPADEIGAIYMLKGISGRYPGYFNIKPHYMNVGIYNNAESRDLWEYKINLTKAEVDHVVEHLWEFSFNAEFKYYFFDENCSYRMLTLLETAKPDLNLTKDFRFIVLPAETIRVLRDNNLIELSVVFRSSIKNRWKYKFQKLNSDEIKIYRRALTDPEVNAQLSSPLLAETLIDYWNFKNYDSQTNLNHEQKLLMETTLSRRAQLGGGEKVINEEYDLQQSKSQKSPDLGHRPKWINVGYGSDDVQLSGFLGVHEMGQASAGYDPYASFEYLGILGVYDLDQQRLTKYDLTIAKVYSLPAFVDASITSLAWMMEFMWRDQCYFCDEDILSSTAGVGGTLQLGRQAYAYMLLSGRAATWIDRSIHSRALPGTELGLRFEKNRISLFTYYRTYRNYGSDWNQSHLQLRWNYQADHSLMLSRNTESFTGSSRQSSFVFGFERFF